MRNYDKYLGRARSSGIKTHFKAGLNISTLMFIIFGYYAYAFYTGSWLIQERVKNSSKVVTNGDPNYTAGDVMSCFFGVVFGAMSIGMATPNIKAVAEGQVAGKMAFDIIDRKPKIDLDASNTKHLPAEILGRIEFKNVSFTYPSRKDQIVLDNFSAVFEKGKTTAIVGASGSGKSTIIQLLERFYDPDQGSVLIDG